MSHLDSPQRIAIRAIELYRHYSEQGLPIATAQAAAIGCLMSELEEQAEWEQRAAAYEQPNRDERSWERGGFAGPAGWEEEI